MRRRGRWASSGERGRMSGKKDEGRKRIAENRKARFEYEFIDTYEAGIVLVGSEVKSLRAGRVSITESFAQFEGDQLFIRNMHVHEYTQANQFNHDPRRVRRLLMHRRELDRLRRELREAGLSLIRWSSTLWALTPSWSWPWRGARSCTTSETRRRSAR